MEETKPKTNTSDEIDLSQLFRWIGKGFRNFGQGILNSLAALRNTFFLNKVFFGIVIASGLVLGAIYSEALTDKFYKSSMILSCDYLNSRIANNTIEKLNLLSKEKGRSGLAEELKIDIATAKNILEFSAKPFVSEKDLIELEVLKEQLTNVAEQKKDIVNKVLSKIDVENKRAFLIEVTVLNPEIIKNLEQSIVEYFRSNTYIKSRTDINRANLLDRKNKLVRESKKLDSLKIVLFQNLTSLSKPSAQNVGSDNFVLSDKYRSDALEVFTKDLDLHSQIQEIDFKLNVKPDFEVIDGLTSFKEPDSDSLAKVLVISFLLSWVAGYLLIGFFRFDKYLSSLSST
jgi:hypothetical protein